MIDTTRLLPEVKNVTLTIKILNQIMSLKHLNME